MLLFVNCVYLCDNLCPCLFSVIALCFSGNANSNNPDKLGGDILVTVTADDKHSVHVWRWMIPEDK